MLSYQHGYHAGNHADVLKHATLSLVLEALKLKESPLCYLDTHAGRGQYDLRTVQANQSREYASGIGRVFAVADAPVDLTPYLAAVRTLNPDGALIHYPGSPMLAALLLRPPDRLQLVERHPAEYPHLKRTLGADPRIGIHRRDAYEALPALLPPAERRGVAFIDPAYDAPDDLAGLRQALTVALRKWPHGCYVLWYPCFARWSPAVLLGQLRAAGGAKLLRVELTIATPGPLGLYGSGLWIVNPPWRLDTKLARLLPWLWAQLSPQGAGGYYLQDYGG